MTDQQSASMMSCAGNKWVKTPAMDRIAENGMRFKRAYVTNPICSPSRFSIMTGQFPSIIGMRDNVVKGIDKEKVQSLFPQSIGMLFRNAGYETYYGGKAHLPVTGSIIEPWGFKRLTLDERDVLASDCASFLFDHKNTNKPFLLFASFINPHDICADAILWAGKKPDINYIDEVTKKEFKEAMKIPKNISEKEFFDKYCPPLPFNHQLMIGETSEVDSFVNLRPFQRIVRENWTDKDWRMHRWAYARLTERVDGQIGIVLDALKKSGLEENTIVIFTSDHGDNDGSHKLEHKTVFYQESINVPFIVSTPWMTQKGIVDDKHVINNGLDLLPTLCDFAGIKIPAGLMGRSVLRLVDKTKNTQWRKHTFIENSFGFLIHTGRYKYELDDKGAHREMFVDLETDPGETHNLINDPRYRKKINEMRLQLTTYLKVNRLP